MSVTDVADFGTCKDTFVDDDIDSPLTESIQPAELIDVYHSSHNSHLVETFEDLSDTFLSAFKSVDFDSCHGGFDSAVGKVSDSSGQCMTPVKIKPLNYVPIEVKGHSQTYSCLSDSGSMIPIIKQSILHGMNVDNVGDVRPLDKLCLLTRCVLM